MSRYGIGLIAVVLIAWLALGGGNTAVVGATTVQGATAAAAARAGEAGPWLPPQCAPLDAYPGPATPTPTPDAGGYPGPSPTCQPTRTPWPSPTPTPDRLTITEVRPADVADDTPARLRVYGYAFPEGARVWLGVGGQPALALATSRISCTQLAAIVPMGVAPELYDVIVEGEAGESTILPGAFRLVDAATLDDLQSSPLRLWSEPVVPRLGQEVELGLIVDRAGGSDGTGPFATRFLAARQGHPRSEAQALGDGMVAGLGPDDHASTSSVAWTPPSAGYYTIWAEIDPGNAVIELPAAMAETNNVISRTLVVRDRRADEAPPVVDALTVNDGQDPVTARVVTAAVAARDEAGGSGLAQVVYVESHWVAAAGRWVPWQWSPWLSYGQQPHAIELAPEPGLRFIQAWVADRAGNISAQPAGRRVSYLPDESDSLAQGEVRVFRQEVAAGRCLMAELTSESGDADLYVWPPDDAPGDDYWFSRHPAGEVDRIAVTAPVSGVYQIEVEAYTAATYRLSLAVDDACPVAAEDGAHLAQAKPDPPRSMPAVPLSGVNSAPPEALAVPEAPGMLSAVHLPMVLDGWRVDVTPSAIWRAFVPMLVRP